MNNEWSGVSYCRQLRRFAALMAVMLVFAGCGGGGSDGESSSGSGQNVNFPGSLVGERIEFTVTDAKTANSVAEGLVVVYDFSSDGRVQGTNPQSGRVLEPARYEYSASGNTATVTLFYDDEFGTRFEEYLLQGDENILSGTYDYEAVVTSPPDATGGGAAAGTYVIVPPNNVSVYEAPNAADISSEQKDIWQFLRRQDDLAAVASGRFRDAYVAIQEDGTLVADSSAGSQTGIGGSTPINELFRATPDGQFVKTNLSSLLGMGISDTGDLWIWAGDGFQSPRIDTSLDSPVYSFVGGSEGDIVISGSRRSPEYVCKESDGVCALETAQTVLDALNIHSADQAIVSDNAGDGPTIVYTDINDGLLRAEDSCNPLEPEACEGRVVLPTGVGAVANFDLLSGSFLVVVESSGQVIASDWNGNPLPVPAEVGMNAVDVAVAGTHVATVHSDGTAVIWRYESGEIRDVDVPGDLTEITKVERTDHDGHFLFLSGTAPLDGPTVPGDGDGGNTGGGENDTIYVRGDTGPAGGIVFSVSNGGLNGLEVAPQDLGSAEWGCAGTEIAGADSISDGSQNTADILSAGCESGNPPGPGGNSVAADLADAYSLNGFADWYLPAIDDLSDIRRQLYLNDVGGIAADSYWSSTEIDANQAEIFAFDVGFRSRSDKNSLLRVRAIRAF